MATIDLVMPKMGESIMEATILKWNKAIGDSIEQDETILEIATDKVDTEVPSPVDGVLAEIKYQEGDVVAVGEVIATISTEGEAVVATPAPTVVEEVKHEAPVPVAVATPQPVQVTNGQHSAPATATVAIASGRFYSPLVKNIAQKEGINISELETIPGTGRDGRVTKKDMLTYLDGRSGVPSVVAAPALQSTAPTMPSVAAAPVSTASSMNGDVEIIEMDRMRKLIADHMVRSKQTSPHVTSYVEADVTNLFNWRNKVKKSFQEKHGEKITFTPIFVEAVAKAINDFPMINVSVEGNKILRKKNINVGMAAALPSGNLIVPVIKNADHLSLLGLTKSVNDFATRARANKLKPDEIQGGTFTLTNVGTFGNVMGSPIINQPQVAILATGAIRKKPAVIETEYGDVIAVRQMMFLSLSYDHRVVDGFLGGSFLRKVADYLETFDVNREI